MALTKCPACESEISDLSTQCIKCGVEVKKCPECGALVRKKAKLCTNCGSPFPEEPLVADAAQPVETESIDLLVGRWKQADSKASTINTFITLTNVLSVIFKIVSFLVMVTVIAVGIFGGSIPSTIMRVYTAAFITTPFIILSFITEKVCAFLGTVKIKSFARWCADNSIDLNSYIKSALTQNTVAMGDKAMKQYKSNIKLAIYALHLNTNNVNLVKPVISTTIAQVIFGGIDLGLCIGGYIAITTLATKNITAFLVTIVGAAVVSVIESVVLKKLDTTDTDMRTWFALTFPEQAPAFNQLFPKK